jgi:hypothetical protein
MAVVLGAVLGPLSLGTGWAQPAPPVTTPGVGASPQKVTATYPTSDGKLTTQPLSSGAYHVFLDRQTKTWTIEPVTREGTYRLSLVSPQSGRLVRCDREVMAWIVGVSLVAFLAGGTAGYWIRRWARETAGAGLVSREEYSKWQKATRTELEQQKGNSARLQKDLEDQFKRLNQVQRQHDEVMRSFQELQTAVGGVTERTATARDQLGALSESAEKMVEAAKRTLEALEQVVLTLLRTRSGRDLLEAERRFSQSLLKLRGWDRAERDSHDRLVEALRETAESLCDIWRLAQRLDGSQTDGPAA